MKRFLKTLVGANLSGGKRWLVQSVVILSVLALGGLLVAVSGIVSIKASAGHWAITEWFLQFSKRRSVSTHTAGITVPSLDDPALVFKGAGHYHLGCFPCHGSPELRHPRVAQAMLPPPPYLTDRLDVWDRAELFYIVKHGIKFTGMPAWPTQQRDDEVWAMVAFMEKFPELDAEEYRRLTGQLHQKETTALAELTEPASMPLRVKETCGACHGLDGQGKGQGAFPGLAGQRKDYLAASLTAFAEGERHSGIMQPIAGRLTPEEIGEIAAYYSDKNPQAGSAEMDAPLDKAAIERGRTIAEEGAPKNRVPACIDCHGPSDRSRNSHYPNLQSQHAKYLTLQLELFQSHSRGGTRFEHLMHPVAENLTAEQIHDVAVYYQSLAPPKN